MHVEPGHRVEDGRHLVPAVAEGRQYDGFRTGHVRTGTVGAGAVGIGTVRTGRRVRQAVADHRGQRRGRTGLDERGDIRSDQCADGGQEPYGVADVGDPVLRVGDLLLRQRCAGHRGHDGQVRRGERDAGDDLPVLVEDAVDVR